MPAKTTSKRRISRHPKLRARRRAWTPERRARQAAKIREWQPWAQSTGPRTAAGKVAVSRNAAKPRSTALRAMNNALCLQARMMRVWAMAEKAGWCDTPEKEAAFLERLGATDLAIDRVTATLYHALSLLEQL